MNNNPTTFGGACKDYFGFHEGQGLKSFVEELKELTPEDKAEIAAGLVANGYIIQQNPNIAAAA